MPVLFFINPPGSPIVACEQVPMARDTEFATLVGKAFLHELDMGHRDSAIAFGRAFLLALGMEGPEPDTAGKPLGDRWSKPALADSYNTAESGS